MTSLLTRPRAAVAIGAGTALVASLFAGGAAVAAGPFDGRTVFPQGHADLFWVTKNTAGEAALAVHTDGHGVLPSEDLLFQLKPSVAARTASADAIAALGVASGDTIYQASERFAPGQLFIGFGYDSEAFAIDSIEIERTISNFSGPGEFALWYNGEGGAPLLSTATSVDSYVSYGFHEHANWGFTAEGTYTFDIAATVTDIASGQAQTTAPQTYTFYVGEELPQDPGPGPGPETTLTVTGAAVHYHTGEVAALTAVQSPEPVSDHFHWFTRPSAADEWTVVPGALGETYGFVVTGEQQVKAVLYDHDHNAIAETDPVDIHVDDHGNTPGVGPELAVSLDEAEGALTISVAPDARRSELSDLQLNTVADRYVSEGAITGITVTDTRSGAPGWAASGRVRGLVTVDGARLDGKYLGWTPKVVSAAAGQSVSAGAPVAPGFAEGNGIKGWSALGSAAAGASTGTAVLGADIRIEAPTETPAGDYTGVVLITVI
ncbi:choice-of-anchor M domain-containing protein [Microbacterium sp. No. 7]|uniref:choice-of-anchor M domain-containing protein n=1 Tax=Microbacterium sp. No. 7 TaxID=1714373 RepID=UPI0006D221D9|nr:choice-of-anchor M domain-containing protein [Microbacterium sp. No. 7]